MDTLHVQRVQARIAARTCLCVRAPVSARCMEPPTEPSAFINGLYWLLIEEKVLNTNWLEKLLSLRGRMRSD